MTERIEKGRKIGQYEILDPLGRGGMATVYRAYQPTLDREVAIKVIAEQYINDATFAERFRREARSIARLHHPNILTVYDAGEDGNWLYIVMELIDGPTLKDEIHGQPLPVEKSLEYVRQIASALDYANKNGIIHRDVKPSNVLIDKSGRAVLSDFGIAKLAQANTQLTNTGTGIGTPDYMSPEQALGDELDARSDQYSLGVMLYELLTGRTPFAGDTPIAVVMGHVSKPLPPATSLNPQIPASVERVLEKALSKKPADRYETNGAFSQALEEAWRNRINNDTTAAIARPDGAAVPVVPSTEPRPGSGPYIPEAEQLYAEARRQESQNNFNGAFNTFSGLDNRFPRYRDVPTILDRYRTMGYGVGLGGWQNTGGQPGQSGQYSGTGQFGNGNSQPYGGTGQFGNTNNPQYNGAGQYSNAYTGGGYYGGPPPTVAPTKKSSPLPLIIGGGIVLLVAALVAIFALGGNKKDDTPIAANPTATQANSNPTSANNAQATPTLQGITAPVFKVATAGTTPNPADSTNAKYVSYKDTGGLWSAEVPDSWKDEQSDTSITFSPKDGASTGIIVVTEDLKGSGSSIGQDTLDGLLKTFLANYGAKVDNQTKRKVDGQDATLSTGTFTDSGVTFNMKLASYIKNDRLFLILYIAEPSLGTQFDGVFNHFVDSFKGA